MPPKKHEHPTGPQGGVRFGRVKSTLKMGIVGLPNVGKSSMFNLMTNTHVAEAANFPFCTIEPNEARCPVPDDRYDLLCDMWHPPSKHPAFLQVWDIAGLIKGASKGDGLGNQFLSHIGAVDGIYHMVRAFENPEVQHVEDSVDPVRDLETITSELCAKDLQALEAAYAREVKDVKKTQNHKLSGLFIETMAKLKEMLEKGLPVKDGDWNTPEIELIKAKCSDFVTTKPQVYLVNLTKEDFMRKKNKHLPKIHAWIQAHGGGSMIPVSVEWEELYAGADEAGKAELCMPPAKAPEGTAPTVSVLPKCITQGYQCLDLIFFITAGEKEVRCWTIAKGWTAPQAAGVIHTDFEKNFIKAEVVGWADFKEHQKVKGMHDVKAAGKYRQEGKTYVMHDGDIVHFMAGTSGGKK